MTHTPKVQVRQTFLNKVAASGLSDAGAARAIGVSRQYFQQVKTRERPPSAGFMAGAVLAGLAADIAEVAEPIDESQAIAS